MKKMKRVISSLISTAMLAGSLVIPNAVSAEEAPASAVDFQQAKVVDVEYSANGEKTTTYEFDVAPGQLSGEVSLMSTNLDQTFYMYTSHRGSDRVYYDNYLQYSVDLTNQYGGTCNNAISVQLHDYVHSFPIADSQIFADGYTHTVTNLPIVSGRTYYFRYVLTSGSSRKLKVRMRIISYS